MKHERLLNPLTIVYVGACSLVLLGGVLRIYSAGFAFGAVVQTICLLCLLAVLMPTPLMQVGEARMFAHQVARIQDDLPDALQQRLYAITHDLSRLRWWYRGSIYLVLCLLFFLQWSVNQSQNWAVELAIGLGLCLLISVTASNIYVYWRMRQDNLLEMAIIGAWRQDMRLLQPALTELHAKMHTELGWDVGTAAVFIGIILAGLSFFAT